MEVILVELGHEPSAVFASDEPSRRHVPTVVRRLDGHDCGTYLLRRLCERGGHHG